MNPAQYCGCRIDIAAAAGVTDWAQTESVRPALPEIIKVCKEKFRFLRAYFREDVKYFKNGGNFYKKMLEK